MKQKLFSLAFLINLCVIFSLSAATGCSTYQGLYPNSMNTTHSTTGNVYYYNTNYIEYRTWDQDPRCGIRENRVTSQNTACDVIGVRDYGVLVTYNPADNNCIVNAPLDNHVWIIIVAIATIAVVKGCTNRIIIEDNT